MDILRIKPIKSGERDFDFLVYYEGGTTERVIGKDACYDFIRDHSGLEAEASDAEISRKVSELVDAGIIEETAETDEEIAAAETEFAAAEAARTSDDDEDLSDDSDDDDEDVEEEEEELKEKKKYGQEL